MRNPWLDLSVSGDSYVLDGDRRCIQQHNGSVSEAAKKFIVESIPEPFIGNPHNARVVMLGKNPGHSEADKKSHGDREFRNAMFRNLRHEPQEFPFYPLNPKFSWTGAGQWWRRRTRELREASGLDDQTFADCFMVVEWFPYHSRNFAEPKLACSSQEYSFQLAKEMLDQKLLVVGMRAKALWKKTDLRLGNVRYLKNPQCGYLSKGNTDESLFKEIVIELQRNT
jgi:hypothetical protein